MTFAHFWFYRFYSTKDLIVATIMLIAVHLLLLPFFIWALELIVCHEYIFLVLTLGIALINDGVFIRALVLYIRDVKRGVFKLPKKNWYEYDGKNVMM